MTSSLFSSSSPLSLSQEQREEFVRNGILVVHNVLSNIEIAEAKKGLQATLFRHGVQLDKLLPPVISSIQKSTNSTGSGSDNGAAGHCAIDGVGTNSSDECNCDGRNRNSTRNNDDDVLRQQQQQQQQPSWYSSAKSLQGLSTTNGSGGVGCGSGNVSGCGWGCGRARCGCGCSGCGNSNCNGRGCGGVLFVLRVGVPLV